MGMWLLPNDRSEKGVTIIPPFSTDFFFFYIPLFFVFFLFSCLFHKFVVFCFFPFLLLLFLFLPALSFPLRENKDIRQSSWAHLFVYILLLWYQPLMESKHHSPADCISVYVHIDKCEHSFFAEKGNEVWNCASCSCELTLITPAVYVHICCFFPHHKYAAWTYYPGNLLAFPKTLNLSCLHHFWHPGGPVVWPVCHVSVKSWFKPCSVYVFFFVFF